MGRVIAAFAQFFDGEGDPLARGWLRFLESGSNNTNKDTFYDSVYQIPNANPLQLDAEGRCPNVFGTGDYRVISYINDPDEEDSPGEQIQLFDPVTAEAAPETGGGAGSFNEWDSLETYALGDIVTYNTNYYRSLTSGNLNKNPSIEEADWEKVDFLRFYNSTYTYAEGELVFYNYNLYLSKQSLNQGNDPEDSPAWWRSVATGYHNIFIKTANYEILPTEFDSIFILGSSAVAVAQFDLPAMDATTDRFRVAIYNQSSFDLTIAALGGSNVWIDSTNELIIETGTFQEFIYSYDIDTWMPLNNSAQALGGQVLGTLTNPISLAHITQIDAVTVNLTDLYVSTIYQGDNEYHYWGASQEGRIFHDGSNLYLVETNALLVLQAATDMHFQTGGGITRWLINSAGHFYPNVGATYDIGVIGAGVRNFYQGDNCYQYQGASQDFYTVFDGTNFYLYGAASNLYIGLSNAGNVRIASNGADALIIDGSLNTTLYGTTLTLAGATQTINLGNPINASFQSDDTHVYIDYQIGNLYFRSGAGLTTTMLLDSSGNVNFYNNTSLGTDYYHYMGDSNQASVGYTNADGFKINTLTAANILFSTNSTARWQMQSTGHILPVTDVAYNIGSATNRVNHGYVRYLYANRLRSPGNLTLEVQNGVGSSNSMTITSIFANGINNAQIYFTGGGGNYRIEGTLIP